MLESCVPDHYEDDSHADEIYDAFDVSANWRKG